MEKFNFKREFILWILLIVPFIFIGYEWPLLPDSIPTHFDLEGTANGWSGKGMIFMMPVVNIGAYLLLLFLPMIDPKRMNFEGSSSVFYKLRWILICFLAVLTIIVTRAAVTGGIDKSISRWIPAGLFLLFALMGNVMINIKPNWFIGIRTPWTLSSDKVWRDTHQVVGKIWFYAGLLCAAICLFAIGKWTMWLMLVFALGTTALSFGYSFWLYRQEKKGMPKEV